MPLKVVSLLRQFFTILCCAVCFSSPATLLFFSSLFSISFKKPQKRNNGRIGGIVKTSFYSVYILLLEKKRYAKEKSRIDPVRWLFSIRSRLSSSNNKDTNFRVCTFVLLREVCIFRSTFDFISSALLCNATCGCCVVFEQTSWMMRWGWWLGKPSFLMHGKLSCRRSLLFAFENKNSTKKERSELLASFKIGSGWLARALIDRRFYAAADAVFFYVSKKLEKFHDPVNYISQLSSKHIWFDPYTLIFFEISSIW